MFSGFARHLWRRTEPADFKTLQRDLNNLKDTVTNFIARTTSEAAKSARELRTNIVGQKSDVATANRAPGFERIKLHMCSVSRFTDTSLPRRTMRSCGCTNGWGGSPRP
jgi:hypothetical protein